MRRLISRTTVQFAIALAILTLLPGVCLSGATAAMENDAQSGHPATDESTTGRALRIGSPLAAMDRTSRPGVAPAAVGPNFKIGGVRFKKRIKSGTTTTIKVRVTNTGDVADRCSVKIIPPIPSKVVKKAPRFTLQPGQSKWSTLKWRAPKGYGGQSYVLIIVRGELASEKVKGVIAILEP